MEYLTKDELLKVLEAAKKRGSKQHLMFLFGYLHGLRASEIATLEVKDIQNGKISVKRLKGSLHTVQSIESHDNPLLNEKLALRNWLRDRGDDSSPFLFTSRQGPRMSRQQVFNLFQACAIRAGIDSSRRNPRMLKHSLGSHLVRAGVNVAYLQRILGHRDVKSTLCYTNISDGEGAEVQKEAMGRIYA